MKKRSALLEPMVWLMFGIPALTAVAGFYTLHIAGLAKATDVVNMPVTRMAQVQETDLSADENAARKNLIARLEIHAGQWEISSNHPLADDRLLLDLQHPIDKAQDQQLVLHRQGNSFIAPATAKVNHDWLLQLSDPKTQWRLVGRLHKQANVADLRAAVNLP